MTVFCEKKVIIHVAFPAKPKMFDFDLGPLPVSRPNDPSIAKIMELLAARRIHTLGNHVDLSVTLVSVLSKDYLRSVPIALKLYARCANLACRNRSCHRLSIFFGGSLQLCAIGLDARTGDEVAALAVILHTCLFKAGATAQLSSQSSLVAPAEARLR
jgi:hypothetical protein